MHFRLCNLPGTFQQMINSIFQELLHKEVLANYMDDFVIPVKTMKELEEQTVHFLKIVEKHNLCFKRSKYDFNMKEIPILEVVVGRGQVQMEMDNVVILIFRIGYKNYSCIRETHENSIRNSLQNSLPYILLQMVCANYCAPYPK